MKRRQFLQNGLLLGTAALLPKTTLAAAIPTEAVVGRKPECIPTWIEKDVWTEEEVFEFLETGRKPMYMSLSRQKVEKPEE